MYMMAISKWIQNPQFTSSEYMTILVKFPENTFTLNTTVDKTFEEYLNMANEG